MALRMFDEERARARDIVRCALAQSADAKLETIAQLLDEPTKSTAPSAMVERDDQLRIWGARLTAVPAETARHEHLVRYVDAIRRLRPGELATTIGIQARGVEAHVLADGQGDVVATMVISLDRGPA